MSGLRAYMAAPYAARSLVAGYAADLRANGIDVTASWLDETIEVGPGTTGAAVELPDSEVARHALTDLHDILLADVLVLITAATAGVDAATSGGRHVETGYAIARKKQVLVVGEPENVFHRIGSPAVYVVPDWPSAVDLLAEVHRIAEAAGEDA